MKRKNFILGSILACLILFGIYFVFGQPLDVFPISVTHSFDPDEGYAISNYTKGGQNATINFTLIMATWDENENISNITEITFELPDNVIFSDLENVSNGTNINNSAGDDWWCESSTAGLDYYLNWSCYNATESQLGPNDEIYVWFNFTANDTETEEPIIWKITIVGNSSAQDANTTEYSTNLDGRAPNITLEKPIDFFNETSLVGDGNLTFNYTANDLNLDTCELWGNWTSSGWHLNETFISPSTGVTNGSSNVTIEDGLYVWNVWCNDTFGHSRFNETNFTLTVDLTAPNITLEGPEDFFNETSVVGDGNLTFNYTPSDVFSTGMNSLFEIDTCELWGNWTSSGWHLNETFISPPKDATNGSSNVTIEDGLYVWSVYCNDTLGNNNVTNINHTLTVDITAPNITLDLDNYFNESATGNVTFNYTPSDVFSTGVNSLFEIDTCELWGNWTSSGWHLNETFVSPPKDATNGSSNVTIEDGLYVWTVYCNDTLGNSNTTVENYTLTVDLTAPVVNLNSPDDNSYDTDGLDIVFNFTIAEENPDKCTLYFRSNATNWAANETISYSNNVQHNFSSLNLTDAVYVWNVECNDTASKGPAFNNTNRTLTVDTTNPTTPTVTEPSDTSINPQDSISYTCDSTDATAGISKWTWTLTKPQSGGTVTKTGSAVTSDSQTFSGDDTNLAGTYTVKCEAEDKAGHKSSSSKTFAVYYSHHESAPSAGPSAAAKIDLSTQEEITITEKQGVISTFTLDGITIHKITIKEVDEVAGTVTITIESDPIKITLKIGEIKDVDVDGDGINDISITLNSIIEGVADITTKRLTPLPVTPTEEVPPTKALPEKVIPEMPEEATSKVFVWILIIVILAVIAVGYWFMKKKYPNIFLKEPSPKG